MKFVALNVFQKTQRLWDASHPYNAAQVARLSISLPGSAIEESFNAAIRDLRLGAFITQKHRYAIRPAEPVAVAQVADLDRHLSMEMNLPFSSTHELPFRPFYYDDGSSQWVGLSYQHWVADSVSIRLLMRQWIHRLVDRPLPTLPVHLEDGGMLRRFGPGVAEWSVLSNLAELPSFALSMKRMRRVMAAHLPATVRVQSGHLPQGLIEPLRQRARAVGATVGDVFLAAAADVCNRMGPSLATARRPDLAMGTIVDLRARHGRVPESVFGLFLGFMISPFGEKTLERFDQTVLRARQLRLSQLGRNSAEAAQLRMGIGLLLAKRLKPSALREFYRKRFPLAGGLSNVNLTPGWAGALHPDPLQAYHRVSPTGPLMPLVFTPTTLGRSLSLCCTTQTALITDAEANNLYKAFGQRLIDYADGTN